MGGEGSILPSGGNQAVNPAFHSKYDADSNEINIAFKDMLAARDGMRTITKYLHNPAAPGLTVTSVSMPTKQEILSIGGVTRENYALVNDGIMSAMQARGYNAYTANDFSSRQATQLSVG